GRRPRPAVPAVAGRRSDRVGVARARPGTPAPFPRSRARRRRYVERHPRRARTEGVDMQAPCRTRAQVRPSPTADGVLIVPDARTSLSLLARLLTAGLGVKPRREFGSLGLNGLSLARLLSLRMA